MTKWFKTQKPLGIRQQFTIFLVSSIIVFA